MDAVASAVGAADLWATLGCVLALAAALAGRPVAALAAALLAVASKESGVVVLPLCAVAAFGGPPADAAVRRRRFLAVAGMALIVAAGLAARAHALGAFTARNLSPELNPLVGAPLADRPLAGAEILARYLGLTVTGYPLSAIYSQAQILVGEHGNHLLGAVGGVLLCGLLALLLKLWRDPAPRLLLLWLLGAWLLVGNVFVLGPTIFAERLFYAPSAPLVLLAGVGLDALLRRGGARARAAAAVACVWAVGQAGLAAQHAWRWGDQGRIAAVTAEHSPRSVRARLWRARWLLEHGDVQGARPHLEAAHALAPQSPAVQALAGVALDLQGRPREALQVFLAAFDAAPASPDVTSFFTQFLRRHGHQERAAEIYARHLAARGPRGTTVPPP
jgi:hypothetical protein